MNLKVKKKKSILPHGLLTIDEPDVGVLDILTA